MSSQKQSPPGISSRAGDQKREIKEMLLEISYRKSAFIAVLSGEKGGSRGYTSADISGTNISLVHGGLEFRWITDTKTSINLFLPSYCPHVPFNDRTTLENSWHRSLRNEVLKFLVLGVEERVEQGWYMAEDQWQYSKWVPGNREPQVQILTRFWVNDWLLF